MRKIMFRMTAAALMLLLTACAGTPKKPNMYIEKAQLTKQEEDIAKLLGADNGELICDFKLDDTVKCIQVNTYELSNGEWEFTSGGGGYQFSDDKGRLALSFKNIADGIRVALQSENSHSSSEHMTDPAAQMEGMSRATSMLNDTKEITYEQEIPLAIQIITTNSSIRSYDVDYYFKPEEYEKQGYEHVYAITVRFSQKTIEELE